MCQNDHSDNTGLEVVRQTECLVIVCSVEGRCCGKAWWSTKAPVTEHQPGGPHACIQPGKELVDLEELGRAHLRCWVQLSKSQVQKEIEDRSVKNRVISAAAEGATVSECSDWAEPWSPSFAL